MPLTRPCMLVHPPLSLFGLILIYPVLCECVHASASVTAPLCFPSDHCRLFQARHSPSFLPPSLAHQPLFFFGRPALRMDTSRHRPSSTAPDEGAERGDSIAENGPARLMMAPSSAPVVLLLLLLFHLLRRMDILPPRERGGTKSEHGNGVEPREEKEGSYGRGKRKLKKKGLLACLLASPPPPSTLIGSVCPHSLTHSVG